jgi:Luciferase-like monooxygenase
MRYGMILPGGSATEQLDQATLAEESGWDGVFVWEAAYGVDAWSLLAAIAVRTTRVTIGTLLTPLPWRRPWKVASQVATVDQLSGGRVILTVGIGAIMDDLPLTGELTDLKSRAERLDEGVELIRVLWEGGKSYHGRFYDYEAGELDELTSMGGPLRPRRPIWVVAVWPRPKSMNRALRCEGVVPQYEGLVTTHSPSTPTPSGSGWTGMAAPESTSWRRAKRQRTIRRLPGPWSPTGPKRAAPGGSRRAGRCPTAPPSGCGR